MKTLITLFIILFSIGEASQALKFGAISTVDKSIMKKKLTPLINYISSVISKDIVFQTGIDYIDTIDKFKDGTYDFGFIGPSPFILATDKDKNNQPNTSAHSNAIGGQLSYTTSTFNGFKTGVTFMTTNGFALPSSVDTSTLGRDNGIRKNVNFN